MHVHTSNLIPLVYHSILGPNRYLTQNPGEQVHFAKFSDVHLGELRDNADFNAQTKTVVDALGHLVDSLDNLSQAEKYLRERVRTHFPRGIFIAQFEVSMS